MFLRDFAFDVVEFQVDVMVSGLQPIVYRLREEDGAVLSACAAERDHEVTEMPLAVVVDTLPDDGFHMVEEDMDGWLGHEVVDDLPVAAGLGLELRLTTWIGQGAAVEYMAATVAAEVVGVAFFEGETVDGNSEFRV